MPGKRPLRTKLLGLVLLAISLAHGATPLTNPRVRRLGDMLECQCGCKASVTSCYMIKCHSSDPLREELLALVESGKTDDEIFATMVQRHGQIIMRKPPAEGFYMLGWIMPYAGAAVGLLIVALIIRFYLRRTPAAAVAGPEAGNPAANSDVARYKDRIEKEMADLDS